MRMRRKGSEGAGWTDRQAMNTIPFAQILFLSVQVFIKNVHGGIKSDLEIKESPS